MPALIYPAHKSITVLVMCGIHNHMYIIMYILNSVNKSLDRFFDITAFENRATDEEIIGAGG